jgi:hydroxymethylglutaryl-CoA reductase (NADPH)
MTEAPHDKTEQALEAVRVPRDSTDDYTAQMAARRLDFARKVSGVALEHVAHYSIEPAVLHGNIENFFGVAQVPIGLAGPLRVHGEHAQGDFYVPLATTKSALVASVNRGMRLLDACGGVKATVVAESMQRAPVFVFEDALQAKQFGVSAKTGQFQVGVTSQLWRRLIAGTAAGGVSGA